ncbi:hypothetical protein HPB47_020946 [Ixodes persulcatus]|uniref:Uncharacterized protein n=1 Tax=Ixodes persulcatus TaxID=34615 RepID=A0AC60QGI2_IXOPE|nr:hypothetical protein HPB47_020946 [Ixodes persulcatus]
MKANVADTGQFRMSELKLPYLYKPLLCTLLVLFLQQFSGVAVLLLYTRDIFVMSGWTLSAADSSIIMNAVPVLSVGAAAVLTDRLGRRILLLVSLAMSGLSLAASFGWLPLASLCVFFFGFSVGLRPLAYLLMGEMLPLRIRSFAAGTLMCFFYACATLTTKEYHDMLTFFGQDGLFWFYGSIMAAGFVVVMVLLPETKGKSLEEIEQLFGKKQERRRPRSTTRQEDERIASAAFDQPSITAAKMRGQLGLQVSLRTIRRRLHDAGLRSRIACQKPLLTSRHKEQRLAFAEAHRDWDASDWASVIFTDESTFTSEWDQQKRVWRPTC